MSRRFRHPPLLHDLARAALVVALAGLLAACQGITLFDGKTERPRGPGSGTDDLRMSPCACMELPNASPDDALIRELLGSGRSRNG